MEDIRWAIFGVHTRDNKRLIVRGHAMLAISEVSRQEEYKNKEIILVSVGTGKANTTGFSAAPTWKSSDWINRILPIFKVASTAMGEYYINSSLKFQPHRYLRIQEYNLDENIAVDNASQANMDKLIEAGNNLLNEQVKRMNVDTFVPEETGEGTNAEALDRMAQVLYDEKIRRLGERASKMKRGFFPLSATY